MSQELVRSIEAPTAIRMPDEERKKVMAAFTVNCASGSVTEFDLPRIKVASGTALWLIPSLEGDTTDKAIEGVIVHVRDSRTYYKEKEAGNVPPDCSSRDGIVGTGKPGGYCGPWKDAEGVTHPGCPLAEFGSDGDGQACRQSKQLFMMRGGSMLPEIVSIPATSLKAVRQFFLKLVTQGVQYHHCIIRIELEKAQKGANIYGKAVLKFVRKLSGAEIDNAEEMRALAQDVADRATPERAEPEK